MESAEAPSTTQLQSQLTLTERDLPDGNAEVVIPQFVTMFHTSKQNARDSIIEEIKSISIRVSSSHYEHVAPIIVLDGRGMREGRRNSSIRNP